MFQCAVSTERLPKPRRKALGPLAFALLGAALASAPAPVSAQLVRQEVSGTSRMCTYSTPTREGARRQGQPLGSPGQRTLQVGRGEPCPYTYSEPEKRVPRYQGWPWTSVPDRF